MLASSASSCSGGKCTFNGGVPGLESAGRALSEARAADEEVDNVDNVRLRSRGAVLEITVLLDMGDAGNVAAECVDENDDFRARERKEDVFVGESTILSLVALGGEEGVICA